MMLVVSRVRRRGVECEDCYYLCINISLLDILRIVGDGWIYYIWITFYNVRIIQLFLSFS